MVTDATILQTSIIHIGELVKDKHCTSSSVVGTSSPVNIISGCGFNLKSKVHLSLYFKTIGL